MSGNVPKIIRLYRMVYFENVEYILNNGMYTRLHKKADPGYTNIGDNGLIAKRHDFPIPIEPWGTLGEYIPFYFAGHSPMLLNIITGHRGVTHRPQHEIVFFVCKLADLIHSCENWIFTDGHAKDRLTGFYNDIQQLENVVDWDIVKDQWWTNTEEDYDRQRRKQAEFLVKNHVPISCINSIVVHNAMRKEYIEAILGKLHLKISVFIDVENRLFYP
jgi:hypothetical protein